MATQKLGDSYPVAGGSAPPLAGADAILKEYYPSAIIEQLNHKTFLLDQIDRDVDSVDFTGRRAIIPLHRARNRGRSSITDGGILPNAGKQDWIDAVVQIRYHAAAIELSDQAIHQTKSNEGAFVALLEAETKGVARDMKKDINRQCFGLGDGTLAVVSAYSAPTITCNVSSDPVGVQYLQVGDCVNLVSSNGSTVRGETTGGNKIFFVKSRDAANKTVTLANADGSTDAGGITGVTSGDKLVLASGFGSNSYGAEMDGLRKICASTAEVHGIDPTVAANSFWSPVIETAGANVSETKMIALADRVAQSGQGEVDTFLTTRGIRRQLAAQLTGARRYNDAKAVEFHGGYTAVMVNDIPVIIDDDCPKGHLFAFNKKAFRWFELAKPGWLEQDGGIFHLKDGSVAGSKQAVWQAYFRWYATFGVVQRNLTGAQIGITGDDTPA